MRKKKKKQKAMATFEKEVTTNSMPEIMVRWRMRALFGTIWHKVNTDTKRQSQA